MRETTIEGILADLSARESVNKRLSGDTIPVTFWIPKEAKARYDRLQKRSARSFGKKAIQALITMIDIAEAKLG